MTKPRFQALDSKVEIVSTSKLVGEEIGAKEEKQDALRIQLC